MGSIPSPLSSRNEIDSRLQRRTHDSCGNPFSGGVVTEHVVVLESQNQGYITDIIETISKLEYVLNTALVYHQIEYADSSRKDRI